MTNPLKTLLKKLVPTRSRTVRSVQAESGGISRYMDASRVDSILRSAEAGDMTEFFDLARDIVTGHGHTQTELGKRKLAVVGDTQVLTAAAGDDASDEEKEVTQRVEENLNNLVGWHDALLALLDSTIYPVTVVEKIYAPSTREGWRYELADLVAVPYRLLDFASGTLRIRCTDDEGHLTGKTLPCDPARYIVHRGHALTNQPDTWGGPLRAIVFWWLFATQTRGWWAQFLERFGAPFMVGYYEEGDDATRLSLANAMRAAARLFGMTVPDGAKLEMHEANAGGSGDAYATFQASCNEEISKIIVGQTLSSSAQNLGLGGGQAAAQSAVRDDVRQYDGKRLAHTLQTQLIAPLLRLNGWQVACPTIQWGGESAEENESLANMIYAIRAAGLEVTDEGVNDLSKRAGLPLRRAAVPMVNGSGGAGKYSALAVGDVPNVRELKSTNARLANESLARNTAQETARELSAAYAPLADIIQLATDPDDLERRLIAAFPDLNRERVVALFESVMLANSQNALLNLRTPAAS